MIFPRIIELYKVVRIKLSLANLQLFTHVPAFSIFSRNHKCASFSRLIGDLITRLHL